MINSEIYKRALVEARAEFEKVLKQRAELDKRAVELKKTVSSLSELCNVQDCSEGLVVPSETAGSSGISDSIRTILRETNDPVMSPTEIRDELMRRGVVLDEYVNEMSVIHNTLVRLEKQGEISRFSTTDGR